MQMQDEYITEADVPAAEDGVADSAAVAELKDQLAAERARAEENHSKFLLAAADFENYKKRIDRQFSEMAAAGRRRILERILPVVDNLERALAFGNDGSSALRDGVQQTLKGFEAVLAGEDVKPLNVIGQRFDPAIAEAIGTREAENVEDDTVLEETQKGYTIGGDVLRPAQVIVAKHPAAR